MFIRALFAKFADKYLHLRHILMCYLRNLRIDSFAGWHSGCPRWLPAWAILLPAAIGVIAWQLRDSARVQII